jgi:alkylation response protein AidB-like acyl-CoA dehydrogenase
VTELDDFRASVRAFLTARHPVERVLETAERGDYHDPVLWKEMARLGLQGVAVPERCGGGGAGRPELAVVFEELAAALVAEPFLATVALAAPALAQAGAEEFLSLVAEGALTATVAFGVRAGPDGTLDGTDPFVLDGIVADLVLVEADTEHGPALFVPTGEFGRTPLSTLDPTRRMARLDFRHTPARRIGTGPAPRDTTRLAVAAEQLGVARRCLELSVEYAKARVQFGRPIGSFQAVKHLCANMLLDVELARAAVEHAADTDSAIDLAHAFCIEAATRVAGDCVQVHGGIGYTWEHPAHFYLKRAKTNQHLFGGTRPTRRRIASRIGA